MPPEYLPVSEGIAKRCTQVGLPARYQWVTWQFSRPQCSHSAAAHSEVAQSTSASESKRVIVHDSTRLVLQCTWCGSRCSPHPTSDSVTRVGFVKTSGTASARRG